MNLSLDNPYRDVTIPRAKLRTLDDSTTVIINPMTLESSYNGNSAQNPYGSFNPKGVETPSGMPVYGEVKNSNQNTLPYNSQGTYILREDEEQVNCCYTCCCRRRCWRKK